VPSRPDKTPTVAHGVIPQAIADAYSSLTIPSHLIKAPHWPHRVYYGLSWHDRVGKKPSAKANPIIYSNIITVSG